MQMNDEQLDEDPNAPTRNEKSLKRVETAIRRRVRPDLLMALDGIAHKSDVATQMQELKYLKQQLES